MGSAGTVLQRFQSPFIISAKAHITKPGIWVYFGANILGISVQIPYLPEYHTFWSWLQQVHVATGEHKIYLQPQSSAHVWHCLCVLCAQFAPFLDELTMLWEACKPFRRCVSRLNDTFT
jgi:hypothetical protein